MKTPASQSRDWAQLILRFGLAAVLLYAAIDTFREPEAWVSFVPQFTTHLLAAKTSLDILSFVQIGLALLLIVGKWVRYAAGLTALLLAGIVIFNLNALYVTFRDFGLMCMALALVVSEK